jgi:hypothetical protein
MAKVSKVIVWECIRALRRISKNPSLLVAAGILDVMFFFVLGFITRPINVKIMDYIIIIGTTISEKAPSMVRGESVIAMIRGDFLMSSLLNRLLVLFVILAFAVFLVYLFFQAVVWKMSSRIAGRKMHIYAYMKEFFLVNIFWMILFIIYHLLSLFAELREASLRPFDIQVSNAFANFTVLLLLVIAYFAFISYTLIGKYRTKDKLRKSFWLGTRRIKYILPAFGLIAAVIYAFGNLAQLALMAGPGLMIAVGIFTIIPAMTWARIYLTFVVEKAEKQRR